MKNLIWIIAPLMFIMGCGDKDEDTGQDTDKDIDQSLARGVPGAALAVGARRQQPQQQHFGLQRVALLRAGAAKERREERAPRLEDLSHHELAPE